MPDRPTAAVRICPNCDGFATAVVSSGLGRDVHGHLRTVTVDCPGCRGTGIAPRTTSRIAAVTHV